MLDRAKCSRSMSLGWGLVHAVHPTWDFLNHSVLSLLVPEKLNKNLYVFHSLWNVLYNSVFQSLSIEEVRHNLEIFLHQTQSVTITFLITRKAKKTKTKTNKSRDHESTPLLNNEKCQTRSELKARCSKQLNSTSIYGRRCKHLNVHICLTLLNTKLHFAYFVRSCWLWNRTRFTTN